MIITKSNVACITSLILSLAACGGGKVDGETTGIANTTATVGTSTPNTPQPTIPIIGGKARGLAFDSSDNLYISSESGTVLKLEGETLTIFIPKGRGGLNFGKRMRFSQDYYYVVNVRNAGNDADAGLDEVLMFDATGLFIRKLLVETNEADRDFRLEDIAVNVQGVLYMGGFALSSSSSGLVARINSNGENFEKLPILGEGGFGVPAAITTDSQGSIYVGEVDGVSKFDANGIFLQNIVQRGIGDSGFESSTHLVVDRADNLYVGNLKGAEVATRTWNILKFDSTGIFQGEFITHDARGLSTPPQDIAFDSKGFLYIADEGIGGVSRFTPTGSFDRVIAKNFGEGIQADIGSGENSSDTEIRPALGIYSCWTYTLIYDFFTGMYSPWLQPSSMGIIEIQPGQQYRTSPLDGDTTSGIFSYDTERDWVTFSGGQLDSLVADPGYDNEVGVLRFRLSSPQNPGEVVDGFDHTCFLG